MILIEQLLLLLIAVGSAVIYNFREEIAMKSKLARMRSEIKKVLKKNSVSREKKIVVATLELGLFLLLLYLAFTMKIFWAVVVSNSMYPTFEKGDMVLVQSIFVDPKVGDIVMFRKGDLNIPVTHRVLKVEGDLIYTGGDASGPDSSPVPKSKILGEVVTVFGKPIVIKGVGNYFILDARELRDITPFGEEYLFYKNLVELFKKYALAIVVVSIFTYLYLTFRDISA